MGKLKGKQPAPKAPPKCPTQDPMEGGSADLAAILAQVEALEWAHGLPPGGRPAGNSGKEGRSMRWTANVSFSSQIQQRLMAMAEKAAGAMVLAEGARPSLAAGSMQDLVPVGSQPTPGGGTGPSGIFPH